MPDNPEPFDESASRDVFDPRGGTVSKGRVATVAVSVFVVAVSIYGATRVLTWLWLPATACSVAALGAVWRSRRDDNAARAFMVVALAGLAAIAGLLLLFIPAQQLSGR